MFVCLFVCMEHVSVRVYKGVFACTRTSVRGGGSDLKLTPLGKKRKENKLAFIIKFFPGVG